MTCVDIAGGEMLIFLDPVHLWGSYAYVYLLKIPGHIRKRAVFTHQLTPIIARIAKVSGANPASDIEIESPTLRPIPE